MQFENILGCDEHLSMSITWESEKPDDGVLDPNELQRDTWNYYQLPGWRRSPGL
jgi:hypothetical protein